MKHYVVYVRGWMTLNTNVPIDMNFTSEVGLMGYAQSKLLLPYKCP